MIPDLIVQGLHLASIQKSKVSLGDEFDRAWEDVDDDDERAEEIGDLELPDAE